MADETLIVRNATLADAEAMAAVDRVSWPSALATTADQFRARIAAYPEGQLVAELRGKIVGTAGAQRTTAELFASNSVSYEAATDGNRFTRSQRNGGEIYQLVGVGVSPECRGLALGRKLVDRQIAFARSLPGVKRILGYTRPAGYCRHTDIPIEDYVQLRDTNGRYVDPVLDFHLPAGATIVSIHRAFRPLDEESRGIGVLIEYGSVIS